MRPILSNFYSNLCKLIMPNNNYLDKIRAEKINDYLQGTLEDLPYREIDIDVKDPDDITIEHIEDYYYSLEPRDGYETSIYEAGFLRGFNEAFEIIKNLDSQKYSFGSISESLDLLFKIPIAYR